MSTKIRPTVSKKREYYISKHRYYELKHFCLQYNEWRNLVLSHSSITKSVIFHTNHQKEFDDPVGDEVGRLELAKHNIDLINKAAKYAGDGLDDYIIEAVTEGASYTYLKMVKEIPCSRDKFYICYHKFFWVLSQLKHSV